MKKKPQRTCIGCNVQKDKNDFVRIVKSKEGNITIDKTGKASGRGAYICHNVDCFNKAKKNKKIEIGMKLPADLVFDPTPAVWKVRY